MSLRASFSRHPSIPAAVLVGALALAGLAGPALAQPVAGMKIAVVDTQKIVFQSASGKLLLGEIQAFQEQKEKEVSAKGKEITDLQQRLADGRLSLAEDRLREMTSELETKATNLRRLQEDATKELEKKRNQLLGRMDSQVMPVINQVGREQGYTMIFRKFESGLVFVDEAVDITLQVIQKLDSQAAGAAAEAGQG